jgi:NADH:ubiquinone oxidoreductase subunit 5 (subunit L)/multisubunit Na+/H+ antiporter MnhA subunit
VVDGALFLLLGVLYDSYSTSQIGAYGGLAAKLPRTATFFVFASLAMIGLPMLSGFVGEFLILLGTFTGVSKGWAIAGALGVILGAAYMLWLVQRIFFGPESALAASKPPKDLRAGQMAVLWPLAALMLAMGVAPMLWLAAIETGVHAPQMGVHVSGIWNEQTCGAKQAAEKGWFSCKMPEKHTSGAKAFIGSIGFMPGLKFRPTARLSFSAGAKAPDLIAAFSARLKSCPDTELDFSTGCDASADSMHGEGRR